MLHFSHFSSVGKPEFIDNNQLWHRMLHDDKLASEGYHELMINYNIQFIKDSSEGSFSKDLEKNSYNHIGYITKTPLLIAAVKWIDLATGHQVCSVHTRSSSTSQFIEPT